MPRNLSLDLPEEPYVTQFVNKSTWNQPRSQWRWNADFYTLGYAGKDMANFLRVLRLRDISTLVDIRFNPVSLYKPEFSKSNLKRCLEEKGIKYTHKPELGVPRDIRGLAVGKATRDDIWKWYDKHAITPLKRNLNELFDATEHPMAFMCVEHDPTSCHRHRLSLALEAQGLKSYDL